MIINTFIHSDIKIYNICVLYNRSVCNRLVSGQAVIAETFQSATIYFRCREIFLLEMTWKCVSFLLDPSPIIVCPCHSLLLLRLDWCDSGFRICQLKTNYFRCTQIFSFRIDLENSQWKCVSFLCIQNHQNHGSLNTYCSVLNNKSVCL